MLLALDELGDELLETLLELLALVDWLEGLDAELEELLDELDDALEELSDEDIELGLVELIELEELLDRLLLLVLMELSNELDEELCELLLVLIELRDDAELDELEHSSIDKILIRCWRGPGNWSDPVWKYRISSSLTSPLRRVSVNSIRQI